MLLPLKVEELAISGTSLLCWSLRNVPSTAITSSRLLASEPCACIAFSKNMFERQLCVLGCYGWNHYLPHEAAARPSRSALHRAANLVGDFRSSRLAVSTAISPLKLSRTWC